MMKSEVADCVQLVPQLILVDCVVLCCAGDGLSCVMKTQSHAFHSCLISVLMCTQLRGTQYDNKVKFDAGTTDTKFVFQKCFTVNCGSSLYPYTMTCM